MQFVTESVREDLTGKQNLFARLEPTISDQTILDSNSSTFPVSQSETRMQYPQRAVITHWFNPPHLVPTVEVVGGSQTSQATLATTLALMRRMGKLTVHIRKELLGFLANRVQVAMFREV